MPSSSPAPIDSVPSRLELPPRADVPPPVHTLSAELPIGDLHWEDFERLCLRLARTRSDVVGARLYGTPGQNQHGIDLFAHLAGDKPYRVYQCKRVEKFEPAVIVAAVDEFLLGDWADRTGELVLCTTDELRTTQREEAFEQQRRRLHELDIELLPWTRTELSDLLRFHPAIVHEFFGQVWVARFCGEVAAAATAASIEPSDAYALRKRLRDLYRTVFSVHDRDLAAKPESTHLHLYERYVVHDILETHPHSAPVVTPQTPSENDDEGSSTRPARKNRVEPQQSRHSLEDEIVLAPRALRLLLGGPGTGKSALLRYLTLDLLSESPRLSAVAQAWGRRVPIWLPFAAWVDQIDRIDPNTSLTETVRAWLRQWDSEDLFPIVERALRDKRLLLLVDGLDEWASEGAARVAVARLRVFAELQGVPVVVTSRPHGFRILSSEMPGWRLAELAPFSKGQQLAFAERWLAERIPSQTDIQSAAVQKQATAALDEINRIPDAATLAQVPLLLSALLLLKSQNAGLPANRFQAYGELTRYLMVVQPRRRAGSADQTSAPIALPEHELEVCYAYLAYRVHKDQPSGLFTAATARSYLEEILTDETDGLGYPPHEADALARALVSVGESVSGLLVKRSPRELGFYHRTIQEHLAAVNLSSWAEDALLSAVTAYAARPEWRDVLLALASRSQSYERTARMVSAIEAAVAPAASPLDDMRRVELLTDIASGPSPCPAPLRRRLLGAACTDVEEGWYHPHRVALIRSLIAGASQASVRRTLLPRLRRWIPERTWIRGSLMRAMHSWPEEEAWPLLRLGLLNYEHPADQLAAAELAAERWRGDATKLDDLLGLARRPYGPGTRAVLLKALVDGWQQDETIQSILDAAGGSLSAEIRAVRILARLRRNERREEDRDELYGLLGHSGVEYPWRPLLIRALLEHWPRDTSLRDACLLRIRHQGPPETPGPSNADAWTVLLTGYGMDDSVAAALIEELDKPYPRFATVDWSVLWNFRGHEALTARLETWMEAGTHRPLRTQLAGAALVGRTPRGKQILLAELMRDSLIFWPARGLLQGWGMEDPEVASALLQIALGANRRAGWIAHFLPDVLVDRDRCRARLLELLSDPEVDRPDFVVAGLVKLDAVRSDEEFCRAALARVHTKSEREPDILDSLVRFHSRVRGVRDLAIRELETTDGVHAAVAEGFADDVAMRHRVSDFLTPLPIDVRQTASRALVDFGLHEDMVEICRRFTWDHDAEVSTTLAVALYRHLQDRGLVAEGDLQLLRTELSCYGPRFHERRQAAYAAALELRRYELLDDAFESIGEPAPLRLTLNSLGEPNRSLVRQVLAHDGDLARRYPGAMLSRFQDRHREPREADESLPQEAWAEVADEMDAKSELDGALQRWLLATEIPLVAPLLRYFSRREPGSLRLRGHCLRRLTTVGRDSGFEEDVEAAVQIVSQQFSGDEELWQQLEAAVQESQRLPHGAFIALARERPESRIVQDRANDLWRTPRGRSAPLVFHALCAAGTTKDLFSQVDRYWSRGERVGAWLYRPLVNRISRDAETRAALEETVTSHESIPARVAFAVPLAAATPLSPNVAALLQQLLVDETSTPGSPRFTYDARSGIARSMAHVLADILQTGASSPSW